MSKNIQQLVAELPEVYQAIYGHPEWAQVVSRGCYDRNHVLETIYDQLAAKLGRPLRVLDLGCAQGFFCLSMAARGAIVSGVDFQEQNIALCCALADENPQLNASFATKRIEIALEELKPGQYDLAIGLSIFHHIIYLYGVKQTRHWINHLTKCTEVAILEIALREEPLYWGPYQPKEPRELLQDCAFFHEITRFNTHLSDICRPLYVVSQYWLLLNEYCFSIETWKDTPYVEAQGAHHGSRRYYFTKDYFCKVINFNLADNSLPDTENQRNQIELQRECTFLSKTPSGFLAPALIGYSISNSEGWLITERLDGELLRDQLIYQKSVDVVRIFNDLLEQLTILEQAGLYHDDLRTWNVLINSKGELRLIDYGSISAVKADCVWPYDIFQSWSVFVNEVFNQPTTKTALLRPFTLSPFNIPEPFRRWLFAAWREPVQTLTFAKLQILYLQREHLPTCESQETGLERWIATIESGLQQLHVHCLSDDNILPSNTDIITAFEDLKSCTKNIEQQLTEQYECYRKSNNQLMAVLSSRSWRLTAPYRYVGLQYRLLRHHGIKGRTYHAAKVGIMACYKQIYQRPALKIWLIKALHKCGYYPQARRFLQRLLPVSPSADKIMQQETLNAKHARLLAQLNDIDSIPTEVRDIYNQLKNKE